MKLYYAAGTCSLSPHIVAREAGIALELERVDIFRTPHVTESGVDFSTVNPNGYVPALRLDDGSILTEGSAIVQYLADLKPESRLAPPAGTRERVALQTWLGFIATELHKTFSPWLFHPEYGAQAQDAARARIVTRLGFVDRHLREHGPYLLGDTFTAADAYLFAIAGWAPSTKIDVAPFASLGAFMERVSARPAVREARRAEGLAT
jgi:glutathione S-transferase